MRKSHPARRTASNIWGCFKLRPPPGSHTGYRYSDKPERVGRAGIGPIKERGPHPEPETAGPHTPRSGVVWSCAAGLKATVVYHTIKGRRGGRRMLADWCNARHPIAWWKCREQAGEAASVGAAHHAHKSAGVDAIPVGAAGVEGSSEHHAPWHRRGAWGVSMG